MNKKVLEELMLIADEAQAKHLLRFFKTAEGQYGEGDLFLGIKVPNTRAVSKKYFRDISLVQIDSLLQNKYHEVRLAALLMCVLKYDKAPEEMKSDIFELYLKNVNRINNWDLVDLSAPNIVGRHIYEHKNFDAIDSLSGAEHLWSNRISVVACYYFIKRGEYGLILSLSEKFLSHPHDLMHKAVGWMLREMGKKDTSPLYDFLDKYHKIMPRTMLRYSIEKLPEAQRKHYMAK